MSGFVVMHRDALEHPLFANDPARLGAWCWLIMGACWKPTKFNINGSIVTLNRGQICVSVRQLAGAWGMSKSAVDRFLGRLETETMIEREAGHGKLVITICNYSKYQDIGNDNRDTSGTPTGTRAGHERDIKEQGNKGTIINGERDGARANCEIVVSRWNAMASAHKLSRCEKLSDKRARACHARLRDDGLDAICQAIEKIPQSSFLLGLSGDWNGANFDFLLRPDSITKILEGKYDDRQRQPVQQPSGSRGERRNPVLDMFLQSEAEIRAAENQESHFDAGPTLRAIR